MYLSWRLVALHLSLVASQTSLNLSPSTSPPSDASQVLDRSFAGLGIEPSNLYSFTGGEQKNDLSVNLLQNLADITGVPPAIRLGGNTGDYFIWQDDLKDYQLAKNPHPTGQGNIPSDSMFIGPSYFKALDRFPKNTPIIFGVNLAYQASDYIQQIVTTANAARESLKNVNLVAYEVGNEPDLYAQNGFRTGPWSGQVYAQQWRDRSQAIYDQALKPNGIHSNFFEPANTASTIGTSFEIKDLVLGGITNKANSSSDPLIAAWNQHDYYYYIGVSKYDLNMDLFTDLSTTYSQFAAWTDQVKQASDSGFPYYLREMQSVGPVGMDGITNTFASSLWTLNFFLYAATLNISGVNMHMTDNSNASAWQPIPIYGNDPHVRPNYYAFAAMTSIIGKGCSTRIANLTFDAPSDGYENRVAAYGSYQNEALAAVTIINTKLTSSTTSSESSAPSLEVTLSLDFSLAGKTLYISRLTADSADAKSGTTWNGISYESSDGKPTKDSNHAPETVQIDDSGKATFNVRDSEAVVANIGSEIGSNTKIGGSCPPTRGIAGTNSGSTQTASNSTASSTAGVFANATSSITTTRTSPSSTNKPNSGIRISSRKHGVTLGLLLAVFGWGMGVLEL